MLRRTLATAVAVLAFVPASAAAQVTPGVMTTSDVGQCTANFLFTDGTSTYVGSAAHCIGGGEAMDTNGCEVDTPVATGSVEVQGATQPATVAYSSWAAMQQAGENPDSEACRFNDFALYRLSAADAAAADPTVPIIGGPTGTADPGVGTAAKSYQNSSLRLGIFLLSPKVGTIVQKSPEGWNYTVYTLTPGIPGDSGSGYMTLGGAAFGVLSTINILPLAGSNGVASLTKAIAYARSHGRPGLTLLTG